MTTASPPMPRVRAWSPSDRDHVVDLILAIQRNEFGIAIGACDQPDILDVEGYYRTPGGEFWVAEDLHGIVGTIGALRFAPDAVALRKLFVAAHHRGKHGPARYLMRTLERWAQTAGVRHIWLGTTAVMAAAHRFYAKQGFVPVPPISLPNDFPRMAVDSIFLHKALGDRPHVP
jgi:GNAT superfamily N-acetyltransferase